jgi:hypothetical protein
VGGWKDGQTDGQRSKDYQKPNRTFQNHVHRDERKQLTLQQKSYPRSEIESWEVLYIHTNYAFGFVFNIYVSDSVG